MKAINRKIPIRLASVEMKNVPQFKLTSFEVPFRSDLPRLTGRADLSLYTRDMIKRKLITKKTFSRPVGIQEFYKNKTVHNCFGERLYIDCELNLYPFQDGNGRVGRLIMFKECLKNNIVPFIIDEKLKMFYYRGLDKWRTEKGYLLDTCLSVQDKFKEYLKYFKVPFDDFQ